MLSSAASRRPVCVNCQISRIVQTQQTRNATLIKRPKRPYTFTQLITLSDGSTFLHRTTSPEPVLVSTKDVRNSVLWNPSIQKLQNMEEDEAGRLKRFRSRYGRGWDAEVSAEDGEEASEDGSDSLLDLMTASHNEAASQTALKGGVPAKQNKKKK